MKLLLLDYQEKENKLKKLSLGIIVLLILFAVPVLAQPYFTSIYWVRGNVDREVDPAHPPLRLIEGQEVIFYQLVPDVNVTDAVGRLSRDGDEYWLNIYGNRNITIDPDRTYFVAIPQDPADGYGADPVEVRITGAGWEVADLTLRYGAGPTIDSGRIRFTWIERMGDAPGSRLRLHWGFDPALPATNVDIYTNSVMDVESPLDWVLLEDNFAGGAGLTRMVEYGGAEGAVASGTNMFFRIVPDGTAHGDIFDLEHNAYTVGKVDLALNKLYNLNTIPLIGTAAPAPGSDDPINMSLDAVIGEQLTDADQIMHYDGRTYITATFDDVEGWGDRFNAEPGAGYWFYRVARDAEPATRNISLVGRVLNETSLTLRRIYNLVGYPYPVTVDNLDEAGFVPMDDDQFMQYTAAGTYNTIDRKDGAWDEIITLEPGRGYWYYRLGSNGEMEWETTLR